MPTTGFSDRVRKVMQTMKIKERPGEKLGHYLIVIIVVAVSLTCLIPFLNTLSLSFSNKSRAAAGEVFLLPKGFNLASYKMLLKDSGFFTAFGVSVLRVIVGGGAEPYTDGFNGVSSVKISEAVPGTQCIYVDFDFLHDVFSRTDSAVSDGQPSGTDQFLLVTGAARSRADL